MTSRNHLLFASVFLATGACAQTTTLAGVVAVQNSAYETGTRQYIPDAAVRAAFAKAVSSDVEGRFRLQFAGLGAGVPVRITVSKPGLEVVNTLELEAVMPGQLSDLVVVMADPQKLADAQGKYYGIAVESIKQGYESKLAALTSSTATVEERLALAGGLYSKQFTTIQEVMESLAVERDQAINGALDLARQFAVVDLDDASSLYISAFEKFKSGKLDSALLILDRQLLDADYQSAVQQKEQGTAMIARAGTVIRQLFNSHQLKAGVYRTKLDNKSALGVYLDSQRILKENTELFDTRTEVKLLLDIAESRERILDFPGALEVVAQAIALVETSFGKDHPLSAGAHLEWGEILTNQGDFPNAIGQYEKVLSIHTSEAPIDSVVYADAAGNLGIIYAQLGDPTKAIEYHKKDIVVRQALFGDQDPELALGYGNLAAAQVSIQDVAGANENFQKAITLLSAKEDHRMGVLLSNYGSLLRVTGNHAAAIEMYRNGSAIITKYYGLDEFNQVGVYNNIATALGDVGRPQEGLLAADTALMLGDRLLGQEHPIMVTVHTTRASLFVLSFRFEEALVEYEWSLATNTKLNGPDNYYNGVTLNGMAKVYQSRGDYAGALDKLDRAVPIMATALGPQHPNVMVVQINRGCIQTYAGEHAAAVTTLNAAIPELSKNTGPDHSAVGKGKGCLGSALFNAGDLAAAKPELLESARIVPETQTSWYLYKIAASEKDDAAALNRLITCARQRAKAKFEDPLLVKKDLVHTTLMDLAKRMDRKDVLEEFVTY